VNVAVVDYGAGNVRSLLLAFERLGVRAWTTADPDAVAGADVAVLPGVGAARTAMASLRRTGCDDALRARDKPTLGICLGLHLALEESEEDGGVAGLGLVPGRAVRIREGRVPRIGWAPVEPDGTAYWFAHSYVATTPAVVYTSEGFVATIEHGAFTGVQFHPEKSAAAGARWLRSFRDEVERIDRSSQTDARAQPAHPEGGTASGALEQCLSRA
jgi:glutamine amidotransferase